MYYTVNIFQPQSIKSQLDYKALRPYTHTISANEKNERDRDARSKIKFSEKKVQFSQSCGQPFSCLS